MTDGVRRAYATLGLPFGASPAQVKRRYRLLVKRWHPDRFVADPMGQAEASERLTHINAAYAVLAGGVDSAAPHTQAETGLSREQIDRMVQSIGTQSPVDWLLGWFERFAYPSTNLDLIKSQPVAIGLAIILVVVIIGLHIRWGDWIGDGIALAVVMIAAAVGRISNRKRGRTHRAVEQGDEADER